MTTTIDVAVVGAGPAGLSAALEARRLGCNVLLIDEGAKPGGQYYRQPRVEHDGTLSQQAKEGAALIEQVRRAGVQIWSEATVWGIFPECRLAVDHAGFGRELIAKRIILAAGAHDRTMAFPGWTLPGVMTPGGAQALAKSDQILVGKRVIVGGSGPFLLVVASELLRRGATIVAVVESARWNWASFFAFLRRPGRWVELLAYLRPLIMSHVPFLLGSAVTRAHGENKVEAATVARLDRGGVSVPGSERRFDIDIVAVAQGFRASAELSSILDCAHDFDEVRGGRFCRIDPDTGETSIPQVLAAGEITGFAGARVALAEGQIAGLSAAKSLGAWNGEAEIRLREARRMRIREQSFSDLVGRTFSAPPGLAAMITADTIVCRCEEVSAESVRAAVEAGARTTTAVKMWTRCGMGRCQGRICGWSVNRYLAALTGGNPREIGLNEPRAPIKLVRLGAVLAGGEAAEILQSGRNR